MADAQETLGQFKIDVSVSGKDKVKADLEAIRKGLHDLKSEFAKVASEGKKLSDVLKTLKTPKLDVSGGSSGAKGGVFSQIAKEAEVATKSISKFAQAVRDIKGESRDLTRSFSRAERVLEGRVIGGVQRDATGAVTGRTGLSGVAYNIRTINSQLGHGVKGIGNFKNTIADIVGTSKRDPATGKWNRTGSKALLHSFDALSKASKGAAVNLEKIAKLKGIGGGVGPGGGGVVQQTSWWDKQLKQMQGTEKTLGGIGKLLQRANFGGLSSLGKLGGLASSIGDLVGMLRSGPLGGVGAAVAIGSKVVSYNNGLAAEGRATAHDRYKYKKRLDASGLSYGRIGNDLLDTRMAYARYSKDGSEIDALATDEAARNAVAANAESMANSWAMFETRGVESPWMTALANQGIDYTKVKDYGTLRKVLAAQYAKAREAGEGSNEMNQWRTLRSELGDFVKAEDYESITYEGERAEDGSWKYRPGIEGFAAKSRAIGGDATSVTDKGLGWLGERAYAKQLEMGFSKRNYEGQIEGNEEAIKNSTGWLSSVSGTFGTMGTEMGTGIRKINNGFFGEADPDSMPALQAIGTYQQGMVGGLGLLELGMSRKRSNVLNSVDSATSVIELDDGKARSSGAPDVNIKMDFNGLATSDQLNALQSPRYQEAIKDATREYLQSETFR